MSAWQVLGIKTYEEYLASSLWANLKEQLIYSNPGANCFICGKKFTLLIHHVDYKSLGYERLGVDVYILCYRCHKRAHFTIWGAKIPLFKKTLLRRIFWLKSNYCIQHFRVGAWAWYIMRCLFS